MLPVTPLMPLTPCGGVGKSIEYEFVELICGEEVNCSAYVVCEELVYLTDDAGNLLTDDAGNYLVEG